MTAVLTLLMPFAIINYVIGNLLIAFADWQVAFGTWYADELGNLINGKY